MQEHWCKKRKSDFLDYVGTFQKAPSRSVPSIPSKQETVKDFFCPIDILSATCWFNTKQSICVSNMTKYILRLFETAPINLNKNKIDNIKESTMTIFVTLLKIYIKREGAQTNYTKCITEFVQCSWKSREKALRTIRC